MAKSELGKIVKPDSLAGPGGTAFAGFELRSKTNLLKYTNALARAIGVEPILTVLETVVLPLNDARIVVILGLTEDQILTYVRMTLRCHFIFCDSLCIVTLFSLGQYFLNSSLSGVFLFDFSVW